MKVANLMFNCSSLGDLMSKGKGSEPFGKTCKSAMLASVAQHLYNKRKVIHNKYLEKGIICEDESINMLSDLHDTTFFKNENKYCNGLIKGIPDIIHLNSVRDVKTCWDLITFLEKAITPIEKAYYWQLQGYMMLTNKNIAYLDYCLVNTPHELLGYYENPENHNFDNMTTEEKVFTITVERNDDDIEKIADRVDLCRSWIENHFWERLQKRGDDS